MFEDFVLKQEIGAEVAVEVPDDEPDLDDGEGDGEEDGSNRGLSNTILENKDGSILTGGTDKKAESNKEKLNDAEEALEDDRASQGDQGENSDTLSMGTIDIVPSTYSGEEDEI